MQEKTVVNFYVLCNKLKDVVRTGWKNWNVKRDRIESIAEHVYGTQMLAIAMWSEYKYKVDLTKVISMLAVHELEETVIGDLTMFQISREEKEKIGHKAVENILKDLLNSEAIKSLILEFDKRETAEAKFAFWCDKLECDLQCKLYDEQNCVDVKNQNGNEVTADPLVKSMLEQGCSWSELWIQFGQNRYDYDENFLKVSNYALNNKLPNKENELTKDL